MRKRSPVSLIGLLAAMMALTGMLLCGKNNPAGTGNPKFDNSVVGMWMGGLRHPPVVNDYIYVHIIGTDSTFSLVTRDAAGDSTSNPAIKDTTLVLTGKWRLNGTKDSMLLLCDTARIIDTLNHVLVGRQVHGQVISLYVSIAPNAAGEIMWTLSMSDLITLAPLMGMNIDPTQADALRFVKVGLKKVSPT